VGIITPGSNNYIVKLVLVFPIKLELIIELFIIEKERKNNIKIDRNEFALFFIRFLLFEIIY
jgi:hypothetical protein